jgi:uncharacterized protein
MANPPGSFIWYELMSPDPAASKAFYDAVVGWTIDATSSAPGGAADYRMITRSDGGHAGGMLAIDAAMQAHGARPMWLGYLAVDDVDAHAAAIVADGGKVLMPPHDAPRIGRFAMLTDPVGVPFYVMRPTPPAADPDANSDVFSVDRPQHIRWNELATRDPQGAVAFYTRHFGWSQQGEMEMGPMGTYRFLQHGGVGIGAIMPLPPPMPQSSWTYYIGVDDIDRAARAVTDGGGQIVHGPVQIPGGEYSLSAIDPQQASFGLVGPRLS